MLSELKHIIIGLFILLIVIFVFSFLFCEKKRSCMELRNDLYKCIDSKMMESGMSNDKNCNKKEFIDLVDICKKYSVGE